MKVARQILFALMLTLVVLSAPVAFPEPAGADGGGSAPQGNCHTGTFCGG